MRTLADVGRLLAGTPPGRLVVWSGAGVSYGAPTNLPLGNALTERALSRLYPAGTLAAVRRLYEAFGRELPRLETVLGVAAADDVHGLGAFEVLEPMRDAEPNDLHRALAAHVAAGGRHVTANFDLCLEAALGGVSDRVLHVHGRLDDLAAVRHGASVMLLDRGLPDAVRATLTDWLDAADVVVFAGYSGSDYFDVDPFLREWAAARDVSGKTFVWTEHRDRGEEVRTGADVRRHQLAAFAARAGRPSRCSRRRPTSWRRSRRGPRPGRARGRCRRCRCRRCRARRATRRGSRWRRCGSTSTSAPRPSSRKRCAAPTCRPRRRTASRRTWRGPRGATATRGGTTAGRSPATTRRRGCGGANGSRRRTGCRAGWCSRRRCSAGRSARPGGTAWTPRRRRTRCSTSSATCAARRRRGGCRSTASNAGRSPCCRPRVSAGGRTSTCASRRCAPTCRAR